MISNYFKRKLRFDLNFSTNNLFYLLLLSIILNSTGSIQVSISMVRFNDDPISSEVGK